MTVAVSHQQDLYRTRPHAWQTQIWARIVRRAGRHWVISRHVKRYCHPLTVEGGARLAGVKGPALIIANHASHFDTPVALSALPECIRGKTAVAAAADRFYRHDKRGWWYSLYFNTFPIERLGGGSATLEYPLSLLRRGWSVLIYPEGTRSRTGELGSFHHGVALMAMKTNVPVIPIYSEGLRDMMPPGQRVAPSGGRARPHRRSGPARRRCLDRGRHGAARAGDARAGRAAAPRGRSAAPGAGNGRSRALSGRGGAGRQIQPADVINVSADTKCPSSAE